MSYNTDPMGKALDDHITGHWGEDNVKPDADVIVEEMQELFKEYDAKEISNESDRWLIREMREVLER